MLPSQADNSQWAPFQDSNFHSEGVTITKLPGKGRGIVATAPIARHALVLASKPFAIARGGSNDGAGPSAIEKLVSVLQRTRLNARQGRILQFLYTGDEAGPVTSGGDSAPRPAFIQFPELALQPAPKLHGKAGTSISHLGMDMQCSQPEGSHGLEALLGAAVYNAYGEPFPDMLLTNVLIADGSKNHVNQADGAASSDSSGSTMDTSYMGLWCDFAMLNHSCCPNTINYVAGPHDHMVVLTLHPVQQGQELSICYFGRELLAPRAVRVARTRASHAFECGCERCTHEQALGPRASAALQGLYDTVNEELGPGAGELACQLEEAAAAMVLGSNAAVKARAAAAAAVHGLRHLQLELHRAIQGTAAQVGLTQDGDTGLLCGWGPSVRHGAGASCAEGAAPEHGLRKEAWLAASMYDAFELQLFIAEALSGAPPIIQGGNIDALEREAQAALRQCHAIIAAAAPGTTLHMDMAARMDAAAAATAASANRTINTLSTADDAVEWALVCRYGQLAEGRLQELKQRFVGHKH